jgi:hydroxymethylbilane synthase
MIRIATRSSKLALTQARYVAEMLGGAELVEVSSDGEPGDKSRFVRGVERALLAGEADVGVHSAKDLPGEMPEELEIAAVPPREDPADAWIGPGDSLAAVPAGARVGTASLRRQAQLLAARPDLRVQELHGNVDTRLRKLAEGELDAIVLATAGLRRLGREAEIGFAIPVGEMIPAAGQGALALQVRRGDAEAGESVAAAVAAIGDALALRELTAERAAVAVLEASCATPIGVHAQLLERTGTPVEGESNEASPGGGARLRLDAFVGLPDGSEWIRDSVEADLGDPAAAGRELADRLLSAGARDILDRAEALGGPA